jgi:hypothetical protein
MLVGAKLKKLKDAIVFALCTILALIVFAIYPPDRWKKDAK